MKTSFKKLCLFTICLGLSLPAFSTIWERVTSALEQSPRILDYQEIKQHLALLIDPSNIAEEEDDIISIAGGYFTLSPTELKSFKHPGDEIPEYVYQWGPRSSSQKPVLPGLVVEIDVVKNSNYFNAIKIGNYSYLEFVEALRDGLARQLRERDTAAVLTRNERPKDTSAVSPCPHILISPQFNNDKQDCMTTFCGGNFMKKELASEVMRARFIHSALTGKAASSVGLGACITRHCQEKLGVGALDWRQASFEGNVRPIASECLIHEINDLEESAGFVNGIGVRNLWHNGYFAEAVVIPFPDMQWVLKQIAKSSADAWIEEYTAVLADAVIEYAKNHESDFRRN